MAIIHLPSIDDYWKRDPLMHYSPIADRISCDRFRELSRYLHFVDNNTLLPWDSAEYDRLGKVRPLIDHLSQKFKSLYEVNWEVAVDEAMIKFQGRSSLKQYMPLKPTKCIEVISYVGIITAGQKVRIHLSLLVRRGNHKLLHSPKEFLP